MADSSSGLRLLGPEFEDENEEETEKAKDDLEDLMERLRQKQKRKRSKSWNDTVKVLKMSVTDNKTLLEGLVQQQHLEALQKAFKVTSLGLMQERLEAMCRSAGLKFSVGGPVTVGGGSQVYYLSSADAFYVELQMEATTGRCCQAKIGTTSAEPVPCSEMMNLLNTGAFEEFQEHLEGLSAMFHITGDKKLSHKVQVALQALEVDLINLSKLQQSVITNAMVYIHKSPVGIVVPRVGGKPMKLIYFVGPYDLLKSKSPMTVEAIVENKVGYYVTVEAESSHSQHKLQTLPLMSGLSKDGKGLPVFSATSSVNSLSLPARFVLKLHKSVPLAWSVIQEIQAHTGMEFVRQSDLAPLTSLIIHQVTEDERARSQGVRETETEREQGEEGGVDKGLQKLPGQKHAFFMSCTNGRGALLGAAVARIPFSHPTRVAHVVRVLRQQVLFNTLVGSCVRTMAREEGRNATGKCVNNNMAAQDSADAYTFELSADSLQHITVSFEHPLKEALATAELDLTDITAIKCKLGASAEGDTICSDDYATKVLQRCLSIPVCMRAVLRSKEAELRKQVQAAQASATPPPPRYSNFQLPPPRPPPLRPQAPQHRMMSSPLMLPPPRSPAAPPLPPPGGLPQPPGGPPQSLHRPPPYHNNTPGAGVHLNQDLVERSYRDPDHAPAEVLEAIKADKISKNPMLASLLDQSSGSPNGSPNTPAQQHQPPPPSMLSALLGDPNGGGNVPIPTPKQQQQQQHFMIDPNVQYPTGGEPPKPSSQPATTTNASIVPSQANSDSTQARSPVGWGTVTHTHTSPKPSATTKGATAGSSPLPPPVSSSSSSSVSVSISASSSSANSSNSSPPDTNNINNSVNSINSNSINNVLHPQYSNISSVHSSVHSSMQNSPIPRTPSTASSHQPNDPFDFPDLLTEGDGTDRSVSSTPPLKLSKNKESGGKSKKERGSGSNSRKSKSQSQSQISSSSYSDIDKPLITVKLNTRELTARTIIKASPARESSPTIILPHQPKKAAAGGGKDLKLLKAEADKEQADDDDEDDDDAVVDLTDDNEVCALTSVVSIVPAPRPQVTHKRPLTSPSETDKPRAEKRRKSSKHVTTGESRAEKKRKKMEEHKRQETLQKKQKIYDFEADLDEDPFSDRMPPRKPTKIKIQTNGPKMQVINMTSPVTAPVLSNLLPKSSGKSSPATPLSAPPFKALKSGERASSSPKHRTAQPRTYARAKAELQKQTPVSSASGQSYKDSKLNINPTIMLKPITLPNSSSTVTVGSPNHAKMSSPISAPVSRALSQHQHQQQAPASGSGSPMHPPPTLVSAITSSVTNKRMDNASPVRIPELSPVRKSDVTTVSSTGVVMSPATRGTGTSSASSSTSSSPVRKTESPSPIRRQDNTASPTTTKKMDLVNKKDANNVKTSVNNSIPALKNPAMKHVLEMPVLSASSKRPDTPTSRKNSTPGDSSPVTSSPKVLNSMLSKKVDTGIAVTVTSKKPEPLQLTNSGGNKKPEPLQLVGKKPEPLQLTSSKNRTDMPKNKPQTPNSGSVKQRPEALVTKKSDINQLPGANSKLSKVDATNVQLKSKQDIVVNNAVKKSDLSSSSSNSKKLDSSNAVPNSAKQKTDSGASTKKVDVSTSNNKKTDAGPSKKTDKSELLASKKENNHSSSSSSSSSKSDTNKKATKKQDSVNSKRPAPIKKRTSSIADAIDKIKKGLTSTKDDKSGAGKQKDYYDAVRLEIVKAGNKTSGSLKDFPSFKKKKSDPNVKSDTKDRPKTPENSKLSKSNSSPNRQSQQQVNHVKASQSSQSKTSSVPHKSTSSSSLSSSASSSNVSTPSTPPTSIAPSALKMDISSKSPSETVTVTNETKIIPLTNDKTAQPPPQQQQPPTTPATTTTSSSSSSSSLSSVKPQEDTIVKSAPKDSNKGPPPRPKLIPETPASPTPEPPPQVPTTKPKQDKVRKLKIDDISERLQSRHFMDTLIKLAPGEEKAKGVPNPGEKENGSILNHVENIESPPALSKVVAPTPASPSSSISSDKLSRPQTPCESATSDGLTCKMIPLERIIPLERCPDSTPQSPPSNPPSKSSTPLNHTSSPKNPDNTSDKENKNTPKSPPKPPPAPQPFRSPISDPGSPEDGLVIDCFDGSSPISSPAPKSPSTTTQNPPPTTTPTSSNSAQPTVNGSATDSSTNSTTSTTTSTSNSTNSSTSNSTIGSTNSSTITTTSKEKSPKMTGSAITGSGITGPNSGSGPTGSGTPGSEVRSPEDVAGSPVVIDDDLMDAALML